MSERTEISLKLPDEGLHPNRIPFEGVLSTVDAPSDKAPSGARGHRVVLTQSAARAALPGLLGMAVAFKAGWDGHDARQKCGLITAAAIADGKISIRGFIYGRDFRDVAERLWATDEEPLGMSYELADAHVADMRADVWTLTKCTFTGAAILRRDKAAYRNTSFHLQNAPETPGKLLPIAAKRSRKDLQ